MFSVLFFLILHKIRFKSRFLYFELDIFLTMKKQREICWRLTTAEKSPINQSVERAYLDIVAIEYRKYPLFKADIFPQSER